MQTPNVSVVSRAKTSRRVSQARRWKSPSSSAPKVQERIERLLDCLEVSPRVGFTASELSEASGLRPRQTSVALVTLAAVGRVTRAYDRTRRKHVWRRRHGEDVERPPRDRWCTIAEAAEITGRTEKALRRRVERKTLPVQRVGRHVFVSHRALALAGLGDGWLKRTHTAHGVRLITDLLRQPPRRGLSAWKVSKEARLPRQTTEVVLAALAAAGVVKRELAGGVAWRWIGRS
jgi:hypothetical protein